MNRYSVTTFLIILAIVFATPWILSPASLNKANASSFPKTIKAPDKIPAKVETEHKTSKSEPAVFTSAKNEASAGFPTPEVTNIYTTVTFTEPAYRY